MVHNDLHLLLEDLHVVNRCVFLLKDSSGLLRSKKGTKQKSPLGISGCTFTVLEIASFLEDTSRAQLVVK